MDKEQLAQIATELKNNKRCNVELGNKKYSIRAVSTEVVNKINDLRLEAFFWQKKREGALPLKTVRKADNKIRNMQSLTAAYYLLGNWALFVPFLLRFKAWWLRLGSSEHIYAINQVGGNNPDQSFFLLGLRSASDQQKLFMSLLSKSEEESQKRSQSAEAMVQADLGASQEYKSGAYSSPAPTTKK